MYKKIKATKNNSLKRAMVVTSIAALASAGIISTSGVVNFDGGSTASAVPFRGLGGLGVGLLGRNRGFGRGDEVGSLDENQKENYDLFVRNTNKIVDSVSRRLDLNSVFSNVDDAVVGDNLNSTSGDNVVKKALKSFGEVSEGSYKGLVRFLRGGGGSFGSYGRFDVNSPSTYARFMAALVKKLKEVQATALIYLLEISNLLYCDKIKNSAKLKKLEKALEDIKIKAPNSLLKLANLGGATSTSALTEEARGLAEKAFKAFLNGESLVLNESDSGDSWESYGYTSWDKVGRLSSKISVQLRPMYYVFQTLLNISAGVNSVFAEIFGYTYLWHLQRSYKAIAMSDDANSNDIIKLMVKSGKQYLFPLLSEKSGVVGAVPLALLPNTKEADDVLGVLSSDIKHNRSQFVSHIVEALRNRSNVRDYLSTLMNYADDKGSRADVNDGDTQEGAIPDKAIRYDLPNVIRMGAGELVAKDGFADLDKVTEDFVKYNNDTKDYYVNIKQFTEEDLRDVDAVRESFDEDNPEFRFEGRSGQLLPYEVVATLKSDNAKFIEKLLALPVTLRLRAMVDVILNDMQVATNGSKDYWEQDFKGFVDDSRFAQGASNEVSWLQNILKDCFAQRDVIAKQKNIEVDKNKTENLGSVSGIRVTNKLVLNGDNTNADPSRVKFSATGESVHAILEGLASDVKAVSAVVCPKTSSDGKTGNKDVTLPLVVVENGKCTVDLTNVLKENGNYEIHFRKADLDPATPATSPNPVIKSFDFLFKAKFSLDIDVNRRQVDKLKNERTEQSKESFLDYGKAEVIRNADGSLTFRIKARDNKEYDGILTVVFFKQDVSPVLSNDKYGLQREEGSNWYTFTTNKKQDGKYQFHVYRNEVEGKNYDGKVECSTGSTTDIVDEGKSPVIDAIAKNGANYKTGNNAATVTKNIKMVLPAGLIEDYKYANGNLGDLDYSIVRVSDGLNYFTNNLNLKDLRYDNRDRVIANVSIELPQSIGESRILINGLGVESRSTVTSQTENGKEIEFSPAHDEDYGSSFYFGF